MALSITEQQVTWSAANSVSIAAGGNNTSDTVTFTSGTVFQAKVQCKVDNDGTPASGDTVDFYLLESHGDPDGASTAEFATTTQGQHLMRLDTNTTDPADGVVWLPGPFLTAKVYAVNNSAGRAITVSCLVSEHNG
jgi:hypothetical protein